MLAFWQPQISLKDITTKINHRQKSYLFMIYKPKHFSFKVFVPVPLICFVLLLIACPVPMNLKCLKHFEHLNYIQTNSRVFLFKFKRTLVLVSQSINQLDRATEFCAHCVHASIAVYQFNFVSPPAENIKCFPTWNEVDNSVQPAFPVFLLNVLDWLQFYLELQSPAAYFH